MYTSLNAYNAYKQDGIMTASPVELIIMLYDALIKQYKLAKLMIEEKEMEKANSAFIKAQDIITELVKSLDLKFKLAEDLLMIYDFMLNETIQCNIKKDISMIDPLMEMAQELKSAWVVVKGQTSTYARVAE